MGCLFFILNNAQKKREYVIGFLWDFFTRKTFTNLWDLHNLSSNYEQIKAYITFRLGEIENDLPCSKLRKGRIIALIITRGFLESVWLHHSLAAILISTTETHIVQTVLTTCTVCVYCIFMIDHFRDRQFSRVLIPGFSAKPYHPRGMCSMQYSPATPVKTSSNFNLLQFANSVQHLAQICKLSAALLYRDWRTELCSGAMH